MDLDRVLSRSVDPDLVVDAFVDVTLDALGRVVGLLEPGDGEGEQEATRDVDELKTHSYLEQTEALTFRLGSSSMIG